MNCANHFFFLLKNILKVFVPIAVILSRIMSVSTCQHHQFVLGTLTSALVQQPDAVGPTDFLCHQVVTVSGISSSHGAISIFATQYHACICTSVTCTLPIPVCMMLSTSSCS